MTPKIAIINYILYGDKAILAEAADWVVRNSQIPETLSASVIKRWIVPQASLPNHH